MDTPPSLAAEIKDSFNNLLERLSDFLVTENKKYIIGIFLTNITEDVARNKDRDANSLTRTFLKKHVFSPDNPDTKKDIEEIVEAMYQIRKEHSTEYAELIMEFNEDIHGIVLKM